MRPPPKSQSEKKRAARTEAVASLAISASWHFLVLAILALAVHPMQLPPDTRPVEVELLPPLVPPPQIDIDLTPKIIPLRRLREDDTPAPVPPKPAQTQRLPEPVPPKPVEDVRQPPAPPAPIEAPRPPEPAPVKPIDVQSLQQPLQNKRVDVQRPPTVARTQQALPKPIELEEAPAPAPAKPVDVPAPQAAPAPSAAVPVLTNDQVIQAPVQTKPRDRTAITSRTPGAPPPIALEPGGGAPPAAAPAGGGAPGGAKKPFDGQIIGGFDDGIRGGLRMRLGCASPDTYKLTPSERAECLNRLAEVAKTTPQLGLNIAPGKLGDLNRAAACHAATSGKEVPGSAAENDSTGKIRGLGSNPRLRDCGPGER